MSLHAYEDAREQRSTFPHDLLQSHSLVVCWLLGPSVHKIRSWRQDNFSLQSYFLVGVFHLKDYQGDRFSTSASAHEGAASLRQKDFLSLPASKKERQAFRSRCSKLWMISANSKDA